MKPGDQFVAGTRLRLPNHQWARPEYRCNLIATILSPANVEGRYLATMAFTRAFYDCLRRVDDGDLERQAGQDTGGLPKSRQRF